MKGRPVRSDITASKSSQDDVIRKAISQVFCAICRQQVAGTLANEKGPHQVMEAFAVGIAIQLFGRVFLFLFFRGFLAGLLIHNLHGQTHLAAVIEAQQLDPDLLAFFQDI